MKRYFAVAWIALIFSVTSLPSIASDIDVEIAPRSVQNQVSSSIVTVTVHNIGASTVYLPKSLSPFYTPGDHLMTKLFKVTDAVGGEAPFTGRMVRVAPKDPDTFFFKLEAGESMSRDVDLSLDYDLSALGIFEVDYEQAYTRTIHVDERDEIDSPFDFQASPTATFWIGRVTSGQH